MARDPLIGRTLDGRYRIESLVASGGMGRIYRAEQFGLGRTVAIKVLTVDVGRQLQDPRFRERFAREAAMASRLTSPHTITIFHYGRTDDDIFYIVMEYVEGITLGRFLEQEGPLSVARAVTIAGQICMSLREAHGRGIVHRDIKPNNVMLIHGDYDQVKVLDFGIAKQMIRDADTAEELTTSGSYIGTPEYMAPECFDGRVDSRADIYSVGVLLYRAITGRLPFRGRTATQTIRMVLQDPVPPIDPALGLPPAMVELLHACLEKEPEHRPPSVDDLLYALQVCYLEAENPTSTGQAAAVDDDVMIVSADIDSITTADPIAPSHPVLEPPPPVEARPSSAPLRRRRGLGQMLLAGVALLAIGGSAGLILRFTLGGGSRPAAAPAMATPSAPKPVPAAAATPAAVVAPPAAALPAAALPAAQAARPAEAAPAAVLDAEGGEAERRRRARREPAAPARKAPPKAPVPEGYKDSPY